MPYPNLLELVDSSGGYIRLAARHVDWDELPLVIDLLHLHPQLNTSFHFIPSGQMRSS